MVEMLRARSGLEAIIAPGRYGRSAGAAGVSLQACRPRAFATLIARKGGLDATLAGIRDAFGIALPPACRRVQVDRIAFASSGPSHWLGMAEGETGASFEKRLREAVGSAASVTDQSDSRIVFRLAGAFARDVLAKGVPIDLHPKVFTAGACASTLLGYTGVQLWQLDEGPSYELAVARSYAEGAWRFLLDCGAEYGVDVQAPA